LPTLIGPGASEFDAEVTVLKGGTW
jgi:hypothetical protein